MPKFYNCLIVAKYDTTEGLIILLLSKCWISTCSLVTKLSKPAQNFTLFITGINWNDISFGILTIFFLFCLASLNNILEDFAVTWSVSLVLGTMINTGIY